VDLALIGHKHHYSIVNFEPLLFKPQQWSNIKVAHHMTAVIILVSIIIQSPCIFVYDRDKSPETGNI
jgi:hypothetical protein